MDREDSQVEFVVAPPDDGAAEGCPHEDTQLVGYDGGNNGYSRCEACGAVLIVSGTTPTADEDDAGVERDGPSHPFFQGLTPDSDRPSSGPHGTETTIERRLRKLYRLLRP